MRKILTFLILIVPFLTYANSSEEVRKKYAEQINNAFQLQSLGKTTLAYYAFRDGYQLALKNGESVTKLATLEKLFGWYRTYGYSCGLLTKPSGITTEYTNRHLKKTYDFDPHQQKIIRDFLCGVGFLVSGVFCIVINPPLLGRFGITFVASGFKYIYESVDDMIEDYQEKKQRLTELNTIEQKFNATLN